MWRGLFFSVWTLVLVSPLGVTAQTVHQDLQEKVPATVLEIVDEYERSITGTGATTTVQEVRAELHEGERAGEVVRFENDIVPLQPGDSIHVFRLVTINGDEIITYADFERRPALIIVTLLFVGLLIGLSRWQGVRALLSLGASVAAILFLLVPALLAGWNPAVASVTIAAGILAFVLFGTHGFHARTTIAFIGTFSAVLVTGALAFVTAESMRLTGFASDASVYLNFSTKGELDLAGLLLGSIIIGILGVLDDVSITQASVVQELKAANPNFRLVELYKRAIRVGKDHIGSLVNTLALAYVGVSLPLILLYAQGATPVWDIVNQEIVASEILRIVVGSIGLILAVPFTTVAAAWYWQDREVDEHAVSSHGHHHH